MEYVDEHIGRVDHFFVTFWTMQCMLAMTIHVSVLPQYTVSRDVW